MMAMSDEDEFVCRYIVAREFPGGRTLRDLCDLWLDAIGAMEPVYKENPTVRKQRLPTAGIGVGDKPAAANPEMTPRTRNVLAEPVITCWIAAYDPRSASGCAGRMFGMGRCTFSMSRRKTPVER